MIYKIVLVDDEKLIADGYCYSLVNKFSNLECKVFYNSIDTLEYIKNNECDILICDIDMPVKNGITLAKEIRAFNKKIKIIFLTGMNTFEYVYEAVQVENISYVLKLEGEEGLFSKVEEKINEIENQINIENDNEMLKKEISNLQYLELLKGNNRLDLNQSFYVVVMYLEDTLNNLKNVMEKYNHNIQKYIDYGNNIYCLLLKKIDNNLKKELSSFMEEIFKDSDSKLNIIYSVIKYNTNDIYTVFNEMKNIVQKRYKNIKNIIDFDVKEKEDNELTNIETYILNNLDKDVSLSSVAKHFHYNTSYFSRYFKNLSGMKYKDYLIGLQMNQAKYLLVNTDLFIQDIALRCGFQSFNNFLLVFKKFEGMTPSKYRKR